MKECSDEKYVIVLCGGSWAQSSDKQCAPFALLRPLPTSYRLRAALVPARTEPPPPSISHL